MATVQLEITTEQMRDLLVSAFEGGSNYWVDIKKLEYPPGKSHSDYKNFLKDGESFWPPIYVVPFEKDGAVVLKDIEDDEHTLTLPKMEEGARVMAKKYPSHFSNLISDNADAETADVWLQLSIFGEIIYG